MKKSDLTRRANRAGDTYLRITGKDDSRFGMAHANGFESGYRAARADLRSAAKLAYSQAKNPDPAKLAAFMTLLRPIR